MIFDSQHFIETSKQMSAAISHLFAGTVEPSSIFGELLMLDGFAMPLLGAVAFFLLKLGVNSLAMALLFVQALVHAATSIVVLHCAKQTNCSPWLALLCALAYAFYLPAIGAAGTFLSEPVCTLLMTGTALSALYCMNTKSRAPWFLLGAFVETIAISRTALLVSCVLVVLVVLAERKSVTKKNVTAGILGMIVASLPWLMITAFYCNGPQLLPDRIPSENMALGCDTAVGGWEAMPLPPLTLKYCWQRPATTLYAAWRQRPREMTSLTVEKIGRLWFGCFNDFHDNILFIPFEIQTNLHRLLIALALGSVPLLSGFKANRRELFYGLICLAVISGHFAYVPFESLPRYAFSAIPFILLLVFLGIRKFREASAWPRMSSLVLAVFCLLLQVFYDRFTINERMITLNSGQRASREILEATTPFVPGWTAILVDAGSRSDTFLLRFNGRIVQSRLAPLDEFPSGFSHESTISNIKDVLCLTRGISREALRQWRFAEVPAQLFRPAGSNIIEITAEKEPMTLYAQKRIAPPGMLNIPALRYFSVTKMFASADGLDGRTLDKAIQLHSRSRSEHLPDGEEFRLFLLAAPKKPSIIDAEAGHLQSSLCLL